MMIFFIVKKQPRPIKDFSSVIDYAPVSAQKFGNNGFMLVAWNEVFDSLDTLKSHIMTIAQNDVVCLNIRNQALGRFGLDPFLQACGNGNVALQTMQAVVDDTFFYWAHPLIGNIANSPNARPPDVNTQYDVNWADCAVIDDVTKKAISVLFTMLGPIQRSGRDQVRICYNTTELARAIIGEIACVASRRLEKILALRLCQSGSLLIQQSMMLVGYMALYGAAISKAIFQKTIKGSRFEYCRYYFPADFAALRPNALWYFFENLISSATNGAYTVTSTTNGLSSGEIQLITAWLTTIWNKIPPPIRCAILMNDIRKLDQANRADNPLPVSLGCNAIVKYLVATTTVVPYTIIPASGKNHVPKLEQRGWSLVWSWNRDEYHDATITYRHSLCQLWAGPSGHTGGNIAFWRFVLGVNYPVLGDVAITCGLFSLWRLYYDKRISGVHTLAETFEATCLDLITDFGVTTVARKRKPVPETFFQKPVATKSDVDAFMLVQSCAVDNYKSSVDPICLVETLRLTYFAGSTNLDIAYAALQGLVDNERDKLTKLGFQVPQWSQEVSSKTALAVKSFAKTRINGVTSLARLALLAYLSVNDISDLPQALSVLQKKQ